MVDGAKSRRPLRILAVDDSAVMRSLLRKLFEQLEERRDLPAMELCDIVRDGVECLAAVRRLRPDVLLLDLEMPRMDGLTVLERLRREQPGLPVIMCSGYTERGARSTLEALARGAADYVTKPSESKDAASAIACLAEQLIPRISALAHQDQAGEPGGRGMAGRRHPVGERGSGVAVDVVTIGVSTGGPTALEQMLPKLPGDFAAPVLIVQHMPKLFTGVLAERLNRCCRLKVEEAYEGAAVRPGTIWLARGDSHMEVVRAGGRGEAAGGCVIRLHKEEPLHHCMPAVDYLFASAARTYGAGTLALVMTGMGSDGLAGSRTVHEAGGTVLVQDRESSAVWGMPGRVWQAGIASTPVPLQSLAMELSRRTGWSASRCVDSEARRAGDARGGQLRAESGCPGGSPVQTAVAEEPGSRRTAGRREVMYGVL